MAWVFKTGHEEEASPESIFQLAHSPSSILAIQAEAGGGQLAPNTVETQECIPPELLEA